MRDSPVRVIVADLSHLYLHIACTHARENLKQYWKWSYHGSIKRRVCNKSKWRRYSFHRPRSVTLDRDGADLSHLYLHSACMHAVENLKQYWLRSYHGYIKRRVCDKSKWQRYRISPSHRSWGLTMWPYWGRLVTSISSQCVHARSRKLEAVLAAVISWSYQKESLQQVEMATIQNVPLSQVLGFNDVTVLGQTCHIYIVTVRACTQ